MTENVNLLTNSVRCLAYPYIFEMPHRAWLLEFFNEYDVMKNNSPLN